MGKKSSLSSFVLIGAALLAPAAAWGVDVWYDFEGAPMWGPLTDQLTADGLQSTGLQDLAGYNAAILADNPIFGGQSLRLRAYNPIIIPTSTNFGPQATFAVKVRYIFGGVRDLFTTFGGVEAAPDKIVGTPGQMRISFEPRGTSIGIAAFRFVYFRAEGNIDVSATGEILPWGNETGEINPHHLAVTWDDGVVKLYFDGVEVGSGGSPGAGNLDGSALGLPLVLGGTHPWVLTNTGTMSTTPVCGDLDDVLVLRRALSPGEIQTLATSGAAALGLTETTSGEVLYDLEGDAGNTLTDKLNQLSAENTVTDEHLGADVKETVPMLGSRYLRFDYHTAFMMPGVMNLGPQATLAAQVRDVPGGIRYLITNSLGGGVAGEMILWIDSRGTTSGQAIRFLRWDATGVQTHNILADLPIPDWSRAAGDTATHHIAATWADGLVALYFDGVLVGSGGAPGGGDLDLSASRRQLRFGGRVPGSNDSNGDANYAFKGDADDILVLRRALSPADIQTLAASGASALALTETSAGEVCYDMEGDTGDVLTDKLNGLLGQDAPFDRGVEITETPNAYVSTANPLFGSASGVFETYNAFPIPEALNLGSQVTLSAHVKDVRAGLRLLFSNYDTYDLKGDFWLAIQPAGTAGQSVWFRYVGPGGVMSVANADALPAWSRESGDTAIHHVAATYDDGAIKVYLDGVMVGSGGLTGQGPLDLGLTNGSDRVLRFGGHDVRASASARHNYPFLGMADDVVVLGRVLDESEIFRLAKLGAAGYFSGAPLPAFADIDTDGDVDLDDLMLLQACLSAPSVVMAANCADRDFDRDGDVDQADFGIWQACYQGAGVPVNSDCTIRSLP